MAGPGSAAVQHSGAVSVAASCTLIRAGAPPARAGAGIDRAPQYLPVPIGGLDPVWRHRKLPGRRRLWRKRGPELVAAMGLLLAVAAVLVNLTRPPLSVYQDGGTVHVDGLILIHPADNGGLSRGWLYTGPATLLLVGRQGGGLVATSVANLNGQAVTGLCSVGPPTSLEISERCVLHIGSTSVTCTDVLRFTAPGAWERRCSDGQVLDVTIPAGSAVVPLPFPLGR